MIPTKCVIAVSILVVVVSLVNVSFSNSEDAAANCTRGELIDKLDVDSELKHAYETADSVNERSEIFDNVIDTYYTHFHGLEMRIKEEVPKRFEYSTGFEKNPELITFKEEITKKFTEHLDKYIEVTLKHKLFIRDRDLSEFRALLSREEQLKFFKDYLHAYNFTQTHKHPNYDPRYKRLNISEILGRT